MESLQIRFNPEISKYHLSGKSKNVVRDTRVDIIAEARKTKQGVSQAPFLTCLLRNSCISLLALEGILLHQGDAHLLLFKLKYFTKVYITKTDIETIQKIIDSLLHYLETESPAESLDVLRLTPFDECMDVDGDRVKQDLKALFRSCGAKLISADTQQSKIVIMSECSWSEFKSRLGPQHAYLTDIIEYSRCSRQSNQFF